MTDPLRGLEYDEKTPIRDLIIQWCKRQGYTTEEAEEEKRMPKWLSFLFKDEGLQDEVAAIENCKVEKVENWPIPEGLIQVFTAIIRRKQAAVSGQGAGPHIHQPGRFLLADLTTKWQQETDVLHFVNREYELLAMGVAFLEAMQPLHDENAVAQPLVCTCQMFGSGKTSLGRMWQKQFFSPEFKAKYHKKLLERYPHEALTALEQSVYVHVKLQNYDKTFENPCCAVGRAEGLVVAVANAIVNAEPKVSASDYQKWENQPKDQPLPTVASSLRPGEKIIFHFDEIDVYGASSSTNHLEALYDLWTRVCSLQRAGHMVYFSGRSAELYQMGMGLYRKATPPLISPQGSMLWLLVLDMLNSDHIKQILTFQIEQTPEIVWQLDELSKLIHEITAGVPRLIFIAIDYLQTRIHARDTLEAIKSNLDGQAFVDFILKRPNGPEHITPYRLLFESKDEHNRRRAKFYLRLVTWSLLQVSIPAKFILQKAHKLGYPKATSILQILRDLSIHVSRIYEVPMTAHQGSAAALKLLKNISAAPQHRLDDESLEISFVLTFPRVTVTALANSNEIEALPIFLGYNSKYSGSDGSELEQIVLRVLVERLSSLLYQNKKMSELLSFLKNSHFGEETFVPPKGLKARKFPQIHPKGQEWSSLQDQLKLLMEQNIGNEIRLKPEDAWRILPFMTPFVVFFPYGKKNISKSADLYINGSTTCLGIGTKQLKTPIHGNDVLAEAMKVCLHPERKHTLLLISLHGPDTKLEEQGTIKTASYVYFAAGAKITVSEDRASIKIPVDKFLPDNVDVVVLNSEGTKQFVTEYNYKWMTAEKDSQQSYSIFEQDSLEEGLDEELPASEGNAASLVDDAPTPQLGKRKLAPSSKTAVPVTKKPRVSPEQQALILKIKKLLDDMKLQHPKFEVFFLREWLRRQNQNARGKKQELLQRMCTHLEELKAQQAREPEKAMELPSQDDEDENT